MASKCPHCHRNAMILVKNKKLEQIRKCMECGKEFRPMFIREKDIDRIQSELDKLAREHDEYMDNYLYVPEEYRSRVRQLGDD